MAEPQLPKLFFGYPYEGDSRRKTMTSAARAIEQAALAETTTWEQVVGVSGYVITNILSEIDDSVLAAFDITDLNENVFFEVGYAIGSRSAVWLLRDPSFTEAARRWKQLGTLSTLQYTAYTNHEDILKSYANEHPDLLRRVIFDDSIGPRVAASNECRAVLPS